MKSKAPLFITAARATLLVCCLTATVGAAGIPSNEIIKANNTTNLDLPESWVGGAAPSAVDVAVWDATVTTANTSVFSLDQSWGGIRIANPGGLVTISGGSLNLSGASNGLGIDLSAATQNLTLNTTLYLDAPQEWNIGTGRTVTTGSVYGTGLNLTKTGNGTVRILQNAFVESLHLIGGKVETISNGGVLEAPGGIILGGLGASNPTLTLGRPQQVPSLFVAPDTSGATVELGLASSAVTLGQVFLTSPLTIRRSNPAPTTAGFAAEAPILGGTAPGTDALILMAVNPASSTFWQTRSSAPNDFTGNVRFALGKWSITGLGVSPNWIIPDASLVTIAAPAQVTWAMSQLNETIDGLAGSGSMQLSGVGNTIVIKADNWANEGARVFAGGLTQSGTTSWIFGGAGTQVLAGNRITYNGPTVIDSGTLVLRDATAFASSIALNGGTLELQGTSGNWSFGRPVTGGAGDFVKSGDGTVTLTAAAAHSGKTQINGGTLALGAGGSLPNTSGVVINGGTFNVSALASGYQVSALLGTGSIAGSVTVSSRLAIGNSPGTMNFENLTLAAGSIAEFEVTGGGTAADLANVSGQLNLNGATLSVLQLGTYTPNQKFTLFAYNLGNLLGTFKDLPDGAQFTAAGGPWQIDYDDPTAGLNGGTGSRFITLTAVPEPALAGMLGVVLISASLRRRRG